MTVELPGVETKGRFRMTWANSKTLLLKIVVEHPANSEQDDASPTPSTHTSTDTSTKDLSDTSTDLEESDGESVNEDHRAHQKRETLQTGPLMRAFYFPMAVKRNAMVAKVQYGLLRLMVPKAADGNVGYEHVEGQENYA